MADYSNKGNANSYQYGGFSSYKTEVYEPEQLEAVCGFIEQQFGPVQNVFHEIASPDIHVDLHIIGPSSQRPYYTVVTTGMGAHKMRIPRSLRSQQLEYAELLICLPPDWELENSSEQWYWPLRALKVAARLPIMADTWLGWGHTISATPEMGEPFEQSTQLAASILTHPKSFLSDAQCYYTLPDGRRINFYQIVPLYQQELEYKIDKSAESLCKRISEQLGDAPFVVDIHRKNTCADWEGEG